MNKGNEKVSSYVLFSQEVYTNLFSTLLLKRKKKKSKKNINNGCMSANEFISLDDDEFNNEFISLDDDEFNIENENIENENIENENDISTNNIINTDNINMINDKNENSKINGPNNCPEVETTENESFIFAIEDFNDENILRTANALDQALNKKNDQVDINTFLELYRLFAEFRWALSCRLKSDLDLNKNISESNNNEIKTTNKQPDDIYNYHKYSYKTGEEIQTKEFYSEESDTTKIETIKINKNEDKDIESLDKQINSIRNKINKIKENIRTRIEQEFKMKSDEYRWPWWQIFLWLLVIFPGLMHEIWRRNKIEYLKTKACIELNIAENTNDDIEQMYNKKEKLELKRVGLPINSIIERQLAFLQAYEVFFKNMILKANDPKLLKQMEGKSTDTFLRENHNLVNSTENYTFYQSRKRFRIYKHNNQVNNAWENKIDQLSQAHKNFLAGQQGSLQNINIDNDNDNKGTIAYKKNIPTDSSGLPLAGAMENTHRININGKNYFTKRGKLFLDKKISNDAEKDTEEYRGNLDGENPLENQNNPLIDVASHGCIMKAFDNFLGLNVLVDTKLIVTPDGYDVFMKSADGKNAGDIFVDEVFGTNERYAAFIKGLKTEECDCSQQKQQRFNELNQNPLSSELQDAIMKINFLDYLCSNRDRHTTNLFVWDDFLCGIDNEYAFFTGIDWTKKAWALCIKEDLPNLIPYATKELYNIAQSCLKGDGLEKLINIYMIFAKTANEKNLLQGAENIRTRAKELCDHFKWLKTNKRILESVENFNSKTAIAITQKSLIFNEEKQWCLDGYGVVGIATGMGVLGYINREIQKIKGPQPKQEKSLSVIPEKNEDEEDDKDDIW